MKGPIPRHQDLPSGVEKSREREFEANVFVINAGARESDGYQR